MRNWVLLLLLFPALGLAEEPYEIGSGDVLRIAVLGQAEMSGSMDVDEEGMLVFPILGKIKAGGLSPKDLERKLTTLLADGYLKRPQVSVTVQEYRSQRVFVTGQVQRPGAYSLKGDRSLRRLIEEVGSLTADAGDVVIVLRPVRAEAESEVPAPVEADAAKEGGGPAPPGKEVFRTSLTDLRSGNPEHDVLLQNGDTVSVPAAAQFFVSGHVVRPGAYRYKAGLTVFQALTQAGGVTERGSSKRVRIVRMIAGKQKEVKAKLTDAVQPEDTLEVLERFF